MKEKILVTGGAGYIGSHVVKMLGENDYQVTVLDNLSTGFRDSVLFGEFVQGDLADKHAMTELFDKHQFDAVIHFAGSIVVPESVRDPLKYYDNNTANSRSLLELCQKYGVNNFIFSSTAAVYGMGKGEPLVENSELKPINPYGRSKLMTEWMLRDLSVANNNFKFVSLRYFNVAGADPEGKIGQKTARATHLIKLATRTAIGKREKMEIFGSDYPTPDGTCIRDYIHVTDLAQAHLDSLRYLLEGGSSRTFNCGYGHGYSVREVVKMVKQVSGVDFKVVESDRREGDPPSLMADSSKIKSVLGWNPQHDDLEFIVKTAYDFEKNFEH